MNFEEHAAKPLLKAVGIAVPEGRYVRTAEEAAEAQKAIGPCIVKAQVPTGKRGKAGGIKTADTPEDARDAADAILGMEIAGHPVEGVLIEGRSDIAREFYASVMNDPGSKGPLVMFSTEGGMDIEEVAASTPEKLKQTTIDIRKGFDFAAARALLDGLDIGNALDGVADFLVKLYTAYIENDAELLEVNPLAETAGGGCPAVSARWKGWRPRGRTYTPPTTMDERRGGGLSHGDPRRAVIPNRPAPVDSPRSVRQRRAPMLAVASTPPRHDAPVDRP